jgi:outer membrane murein-binding lipoprotein Lpp
MENLILTLGAITFSVLYLAGCFLIPAYIDRKIKRFFVKTANFKTTIKGVK